MVSRQDLREVNEAAQELQEALDEMRELHEGSKKEGVTVDGSAYTEAQQRMKDAVNRILHASNDAVDRTDVYEPDDEGETDVSLPEAALNRNDSASLPNAPSGGNN